jgi:hypothetical protein
MENHVALLNDIYEVYLGDISTSVPPPRIFPTYAGRQGIGRIKFNDMRWEALAQTNEIVEKLGNTY